MSHLAPARLSIQLCHACQFLQAPMLYGKVCMINLQNPKQALFCRQFSHRTAVRLRPDHKHILLMSTHLARGHLDAALRRLTSSQQQPRWHVEQVAPPPTHTVEDKTAFLGQSQGTDSDTSDNRQHPVLSSSAQHSHSEAIAAGWPRCSSKGG